MKPVYFIILVVILVNLFLLPTFLLKVPPIWPDESLFAEVANNILRENRVGSDFWGEKLIPGIKNCACWYPPVFFYLLAGWFKIFGLNVESQRMFSVVVSGLFLVIFYLLVRLVFEPGRKQSVNSWWWGLPLVGLLIDFVFLQASRFSRPEIFLVLFGTLSIYFYFKSFISAGRNSLFLSFLSGLSASLAFLVHMVSGIFCLTLVLHQLVDRKLSLFKSGRFYVFSVGFFLPIIIWLIAFWSKIDIIYQQFVLQSARKYLETPWLLTVLREQAWENKIIYLSYVAISVIFFFFALFYTYRNRLVKDELVSFKSRAYSFLGILLLVIWIFLLLGRQIWYYVFPVPFIYLAAIILIREIPKKDLSIPPHLKAWGLTLVQGLFFLLIAANLYYGWETYNVIQGENYSYHRLEKKVLDLIPQGKSVLLSSIPDYYYGLYKRGEKNIYRSPMLALEDKRGEYFDLLGRADYIIYTPHKDIIFGNFLENYMTQNKIKIYKLSEPFQDEVFVVQLKPTEERIDPGP